MKREEIVKRIIESKVVAIIRMDKSDEVISVAEAMIEGGIVSLEVTMTTPNALQIIKELSDNYGSNVLIGVGSIVDAETAIKAIEAGAKYIISPIFKKEIVEASHKLDIPAIPGCYTPTEIFTAQEAGADIVKVFPADQLGTNYMKAIKAPMPQLNVMPTGGVTLTNAGSWINAGACAVAVGSNLLDKAAIEENNFGKIKANAELIIENIINRREV